MNSHQKTRRKLTGRGTFYVYIVACIDGTYYTGATGDLKERITRHNQGRGAKYVRGRRPVELVYAHRYRDYKLALIAERKIKTLTRTEKEALIVSGEK